MHSIPSHGAVWRHENNDEEMLRGKRRIILQRSARSRGFWRRSPSSGDLGLAPLPRHCGSRGSLVWDPTTLVHAHPRHLHPSRPAEIFISRVLTKVESAENCQGRKSEAVVADNDQVLERARYGHCAGCHVLPSAGRVSLTDWRAGLRATLQYPQPTSKLGG